MSYEVIALFGPKKSHGTFDDFFDPNKYKTIEEAWEANDFVQSDFVKDEEGILHIEAKHVQRPEVKKYRQLMIQRCFFGIDTLDDHLAAEMSSSLL